MESQNFFIASVLFLILTIALFGLIILGLRYALQQVSWHSKKKNKVMLGTATGFVLWIALSGILAANGFFTEFQAMPPRFVLLILPPLLFIMWLAFSPSFALLLHAIPQAWLIYIQLFRIIVEIVLWLVFLDNIIPVQMTFEGRNFDILTGLTAPVVAYFCFHRKVWSWKAAVVWNILGIALVVNIVLISILSAPTPFRVFMNEPANTFIAHLPFVWLPAFVVPVAYWLHILSIKQLLSKKEAAKQTKSFILG